MSLHLLFSAAFLMAVLSCNRMRTNADANQQGLPVTDSAKIIRQSNPATGESAQKKEPDWLTKLYDTDGQGEAPHAVAKVIYAHKLTDSTYYWLAQVAEVNCTVTVLVTTKNSIDLSAEVVGRSCDMDYAYYKHSGVIFVLDSLNNAVTILSYNETAKTKYLVKDKEGFSFKEGYDMENAETITDSVITLLKIMPTGVLTKKTAAARLWRAAVKQNDSN